MKTIEVADDEAQLLESIAKEYKTNVALVVKSLLAASECYEVDSAIKHFKSGGTYEEEK